MSVAEDRLVVGGYELGDRIGVGRIAQVYRARGAAGELAIKLLAPDAELDDPAAVARFRQEVDALGSVHHPNVVELIDHGVDDELGPFLVMPLLEGRTLRQLMADGPVEPWVCALAVKEIAGGLGALHDAGIIHRDLKPENVIVDSDGRPVIIDLGLAWAETQTRHTEEGAIAGSVPYMSPEQIEGRMPLPGTDLWALAVIAHEWITGSRPFARPRQSEEVAAILSRQFVPLVERDRRVDPKLGKLIDSCFHPLVSPSHGRDLRQRLAELVRDDAQEALRDPQAKSAYVAETHVDSLLTVARRYLAQGKAFKAADCVERAAAHLPGDARVLALAEEVGRAPSKPRWPGLRWIAGGLAALAIAGGGLAWFMSRGGGGQEPAAAPTSRPALTAEDVPEEADADRDGLARLEVPRHEGLFDADDIQGGAIGYTMRHLPDEVNASSDPVAHATYARALMATTRRAEGIAFLDGSLERFPEAAGLWLLRGQAAMRTGDLDRADDALSRAITLDPSLAAAFRDRGELRRLRGKLRAAFRDLSRAHALAPEDPAPLGGLVRIHVAIGRGEQARALAVRATELAPKKAAPWIDLASVSPDQEALAHLEMALRSDSMSAPARRAICLVGTRVDDARALDDCNQASVHYRHDPEIVLARSTLWKRRGNLERARAEVRSGIYIMKDNLELWLEMIALEQALGDEYSLPKSRARACELGHQPSCPAATADRPVAP